jgi:hypothetical protein
MNESFVSVFSGWIGLLTSLLFVGLFLLIWMRTRSLHIPMYRLWRLFYGAKEIEDEGIRQFMADQSSLMHFRFMNGIRVKSLRECNKLIEWARHQDVDMADVAACGQHFDRQRCEIKQPLPSVRARIVWFPVFVGSAISAMVMVGAVSTDRALASFKSTERHFWLRTQDARPLWPLDAPILRASECSKSTEHDLDGAFTAEERQILCSSFTDAKDVANFVSRAVASQRWLFACLALLLLWLTLWSGGALKCIGSAERLMRQLESRIKSCPGDAPEQEHTAASPRASLQG